MLHNPGGGELLDEEGPGQTWTHSSGVEEELPPSGGWGFIYCLHHSIKLGKNGTWRGRWYDEHEHSGVRNELGLVYRGWGHHQDEDGDL